MIVWSDETNIASSFGQSPWTMSAKHQALFLANIILTVKHSGARQPQAQGDRSEWKDEWKKPNKVRILQKKLQNAWDAGLAVSGKAKS